MRVNTAGAAVRSRTKRADSLTVTAVNSTPSALVHLADLVSSAGADPGDERWTSACPACDVLATGAARNVVVNTYYGEIVTAGPGYALCRGMANLDRSDIRHVLAARREALLARWRGEIERECERRGLGASGWRALARPHRDAHDFGGHFGTIAGTKARELGEIIAAMRRLDHGRYGICVYCGCVIDDERLAALPETRVCESCAEPADAEEGEPCAPL